MHTHMMQMQKQILKEKESQKFTQLNPLVTQDIGTKQETNVRKPAFDAPIDKEGMLK